MKTRMLILTVAAWFISVPGVAATLRFDNEAAFLSTAGPVSLESFEGLPATNSNSVRTVVTPGFTLTDTGPTSGGYLGVFNRADVGQHATHGRQYVSLNSVGNRTLQFDFANAVNSLGFTLTDWGDIAGTGATLRFTDNAGDNFTIATAPRPDANELFFGIVNRDRPFATATIASTGGEIYGIDEVYCAVPEPATLSLFTAFAGCAAVCGWAYKRRRK